MLISLSVDSADLEHLLTTRADRAGTLQAGMNDAADELMHINERRFASQGRNSSTPWKQLRPGYAARKGREFPGQPILVRTEHLKDSLTKRGTADSVRRVTADEAYVGTTVLSARFVNKKRRIVSLAEQERARLMQRLQDYLTDGL